MLVDRGFAEIVDHELNDENALGLVMIGRGGDVETRVHICIEDRVGVKFARNVLESAQGGKCIIVSIDGPTPFTRKECNTVQFFTAIEMCKNVTHHCLVPQHTRIEASQLPGGMHVDRLPRLLSTDRVVQYHGWPCGTVVKIKRVFGGAEPIDYFRVVAAAV